MCDRTDNVMTNVDNKIEKFEGVIAMNKSKVIFAFFYSPSCGWCKRFKPVFEKYLNKCSVSDNIIMIMVNLETASELFEKYNVDGFPTTIMFNNGVESDRVVGADENKLKQLMGISGLRVD